MNCSILFTETPLSERPLAARQMGFRSMESWWPFATPTPGAKEVDAWVAAVESSGLQLVALNLFSGDLTRGDRGILSVPDREREFEQAVASLLRIAERLGCHMFNAPYGRLDPRWPEAQQHETARQRLELLASATASLDGTILLEPMSGFDDYPLKAVADVTAVISSLSEGAGERIGLLADLYHLGRNGEDVDALLERPSTIAHVQVADAPGRHEPGTGSLPIDRWLETLASNGYSGRVALEYEPTADTARAFDWLD